MTRLQPTGWLDADGVRWTIEYDRRVDDGSATTVVAPAHAVATHIVDPAPVVDVPANIVDAAPVVDQAPVVAINWNNWDLMNFS